MSVAKDYTLANGVVIPSVGYGTWRTKPEDFAKECVKMAVEQGYRLIDCAAVYKNEKGIGEALRQVDVPREELFLTSKVWCMDRGYEKTKAAFEKTCKDLGTDYLDLYLIHWPSNKNYDEDPVAVNASTWRGMEELYKAGRIRSIGVSNFKPHQLQSLFEHCEIRPMVNQIECHPGWYPEETVKFCQENGILVQAWSPLGSGAVLGSETLLSIAKAHGKDAGQVCIRWCLQKGINPLPKSTKAQRALSNLDVFDFTLTEEEMAAIDAMETLGYSELDSDTVLFDH